MNEISLRKFAPRSDRRDSSSTTATPLLPISIRAAARVICIPASEIADKLGSTKVANIVLMGALLEETDCLDFATASATIAEKIKKVALADMNRRALDLGRRFVDNEIATEAQPQPDGYPY